MLEKIENLIQRYFEMEDGAMIEAFHEEIVLSNDEIFIKLKHRVLKHVVEKRKQDNYDMDKILNLFKDFKESLENKTYKIINNRSEKSFLFLEDTNFIENIDKKDGVIMVLEIIQESQNVFYIKTGFYRSITKIKKMLKQK